MDRLVYDKSLADTARGLNQRPINWPKWGDFNLQGKILVNGGRGEGVGGGPVITQGFVSIRVWAATPSNMRKPQNEIWLRVYGRHKSDVSRKPRAVTSRLTGSALSVYRPLFVLLCSPTPLPPLLVDGAVYSNTLNAATAAPTWENVL